VKSLIGFLRVIYVMWVYHTFVKTESKVGNKIHPDPPLQKEGRNGVDMRFANQQACGFLENSLLITT